MQPRFSFLRALVIPIATGVFLLLSACGPGRSLTPPTATPSSFNSLEPGMLTSSPTAPFVRDENPATATGPVSYPGPSGETLAAASPSATETLPPPSATPTPEGIQPLAKGKYDDTDPNIAYDPNWIALKNASTASSYKGTIHASYDAGSEASFRFTGTGVQLGYKRGKSFGTVTVLIDDQSYTFNEQAFDLVWRSPQLSPGDHFVRVIHQSGESINLDYIVVLE